MLVLSGCQSSAEEDRMGKKKQDAYRNALDDADNAMQNGGDPVDTFLDSIVKKFAEAEQSDHGDVVRRKREMRKKLKAGLHR